MATLVVTAANMWAGGIPLQSFTNQVTVNMSPEVREATTFGSSGAREYLPGLISTSLAFNGYASAAEPDASLHAELAATSPYTISPTGTVDTLCYLVQGVSTDYGRTMQVGEMWGSQFTAQGTGKLQDGYLLEVGDTARIATGTSTGSSNPGTSTSGDTIYGALHVTAASGTTPTLDVVIQSDSTGAFSAPSNRLSFAQATAIGSEWATAAAGASTDTFWRISYTIGGTTPSFTFAVSFGFSS